MTDHQFATIWADALTEADRDAFVSDWSLSSTWEDETAAEIPAERLDLLGRIWDVARMSARDLVRTSGLSQARFAERFCLPKRTVENWCAGVNAPPDYVRLMLARLMGLL